MDVSAGLKAAVPQFTWNSFSRLGQTVGWLFSSCTLKLIHLFGRELLLKQKSFKPEWFLKGDVPSLHPKAILLHNPNQTLTMKLLLWVLVLPLPLSSCVIHQEQWYKSTFHCSILLLPILLQTIAPEASGGNQTISL